MNTSKKIDLDFSKLYGYKLNSVDRKAATASKVGKKVFRDSVIASSKVGSKIGIKVPN